MAGAEYQWNHFADTSPDGPFEGLPKRFPMVIDMSTGFHFRREGKGILLAWNDPEETPGFKTEFDPGFVEKILTRAADRVPCLAEAAVNPRRAWAGLYEMTPDHHSIMALRPISALFRAVLRHGVMLHCLRRIPRIYTAGQSDLIETSHLNALRFSESNYKRNGCL